ncbi:MAG: glucose dehydrogenase [Hyphomicrobiales bacterium]|nr:glucose dehydrogenase [Hyphomicrobiales bacterium]
MPKQREIIYGWLLAVLLGLSGLALLMGGIRLVGEGGSPYYLVAGAAFLATGILVWRRNALALWLYAATLLGTLLWALWEVGFDWWQLAPRGDLVVVLGVLLALPWAVHTLDRPATGARGGWVALGGVLAISLLVALVALILPWHELGGSLPANAAPSVMDTAGVPDNEWHAYGRTGYGERYSPLDQITPQNVGQLQVAWTYHTGDIRNPQRDPTETTYEVTPLLIADTLYLCTPHDLVIALDAETGQQKWRFDPKINEPPKIDTQHLTCRGLSYAPAPAAGAAPATPAAPDCSARLFLPTVDGRLIAISAATGKICPGFGGPSGTVNLWANMPNVTAGSYYSTSPPVVTSHLIIVGGAVNDNVSTKEPSGVIRAFDLNSGALVWNWDSRNPDATAPIAPNATYSENSPNSWSVSSYDPKLGLVYVPMGNQPPDQYGAGRDANVEKYSAAVVALNAETGKVAWVFQGTHHDLWDMDVPAQPSLLDLTIAGKTVPALVVPTKQAEIFVLNRQTGVPILPVTEETAPQGAAPGDKAAPTQPHSALSFQPANLTEASMWGISPFDQMLCRIDFRSLRYEGRNTPPSEQGSLIYPGNFGTFNWGGVAVDPQRQAVFAMPVYLAFTSQLVKRPDATSRVVTKPDEPPFNENFGAPYAVKMGAFLSALGIPCQAPPWGYVAGADLTTGKIAYQHVNGTVRDLSAVPLPLKLGVPGIGGPIVTKGGVAFLTSTLDYYARAYDLVSGKQLWESRLPAGGQATPVTYLSKSGRQFLVVVAGGHGSTGTKAGDTIIGYTLPKQG